MPETRYAFSAEDRLCEPSDRETMSAQALTRSRREVLSHRGVKYLAITRDPARLTDRPDLYKIFAHHSDKAFVKESLFQIFLFLKQPEIDGLILDSPDMFDSPALLTTINDLVMETGRSLRYLQPGMVKVTDLDRFMNKILDQSEYTRLPFPRRVTLEFAIGNCNLKCRMCPQAENDYRPRVIDPQGFQRVLDGIPRDWPLTLSLTGFCEPLLVSGFIEMAAQASRSLPRALVKFNTNGTHLTEDMARMLVESGLGMIWFSLNMHTREDYLWFTGRDLYDRVCRNIVLMREVRDRLNGTRPQIRVQMMNLPRNAEHRRAFIEKWSRIADDVYIRDLSNWGGMVDIDGRVMESAPRREYLKKHYPCISLWQDLVVNWNGDIYPCCTAASQPESYPSLRLGNIAEDRLPDVWNGAALAELRLRQYMDLEPACRGCEAYMENSEELSLILSGAIQKNIFGKTTRSGPHSS